MSTVSAGQKLDVTLQVGETLRVVAGAVSSGLVRRLGMPGDQRQGPQNTDVPVSGTRQFGPFPTIRRYSIECAVGALTYTAAIDDLPTATHLGNIEGFSGARTLRSEDNGKIFRCDDASGVTVTVSNDLPEGFNVGFAKWGAGTVTIAAASGATNRTSKTALATQYNSGTLVVLKNGTGSAAEFVLGGDFA